LAFVKCHGLCARLILRPYLALCAIICLSITYTCAPTINVGLISQTPTFRWLWRCWPTAFPHCSVSNTNALGFETRLPSPSLCLRGQLKRSITLPQNVRLSSFLSICNSLTLVSSSSFRQCIRPMRMAMSVSSSTPCPTVNRLTLSSMAYYPFTPLRLEGVTWW
jgi:hypothetical protein